MQNADSLDHANVAFHPPVLLALTLFISFLMRRITPLAFLPQGFSISLGPAITAVSFGFFFWAVFTMRAGNASIPTGKPTETIVTNGPYKYSRNPIYLSMLLLQIGVGIWTNSFWFIGLAVLFAVLLWWGVISREEQYLGRKFGDEYLQYRAGVRRWI